MEGYIEKQLKDIKKQFKVQTIITGALIILAIIICLMNLKQEIELKEKDEKIEAMAELIESLKGEFMERRCRNCNHFPCTKVENLNGVCENHEYESEEMIKEIDKKGRKE